MSEKPVIFRIEDIRKEATDIRSFWFKGSMNARPGQFVMLWIPGAGQKPFGISYQKEDSFALTIRKVGGLTGELFRLKKGDRVGIQGPYGRAFSEKGENVVLVGGGYGTAPLAFLADEMSANGKVVTMITGAATKDLLVFRDRFKNSSVKTIYATDDGSFGHKGFCTDCLLDSMTGGGMDYVYCCGPEIMMQKVFQLCKDAAIPAEFSLERYMKCGFGVCGSCTLDPTGWRVCKDGPVFTVEELSKVSEFGEYKRDPSGRKGKL